MKKVLVIAPKFFSYGQSILDAFVMNNYKGKLIEIDEFHKEIFLRVIYSYLPKINIDYFYKKSNIIVNKYIYQQIINEKPDIIFVVYGDFLLKETLVRIKKMLPKSIVILWMMDNILKTKNTLKCVHLYNYVFLFEKDEIKKIFKLNKNVFFLPLTFDPKVYFPINNLKKDIDIVFIGNLTDLSCMKKRRKILEYIVKKHKNLNIVIYGKYINWKIPTSYIKYKLNKNIKEAFKNDIISPKEVNKLYARSKICLNILGKQSRYGINQRFFEILGTSSIQMVDDGHGFISKNFIIDKEIFTFKDLKDLDKKIVYILNNYEKIKKEIETREEYKKVLKNHTFLSRISQILNTIKEDLSN
jgi:spore maturation protein CgeB